MQDRTAHSQPGLKNLGKYEIRGLLRRGSMGMVYLAHDPFLDRDVAIKVMVGSSVDDGKTKERFEREAKAVARLHHPNIVTIYEYGYDQWHSPFIAMELLYGTDLGELVETDPPPIGRKLEIITQVCEGLEHAHGLGIVHRDVKPANIFVTGDWIAKITDFGVARWMRSSQTQAGIVVGTAGYMSPEQIRSKAVDGRSDIFSLGVVLFEILTNQALFSGETIEAIVFNTIKKSTPLLAMPDGTVNRKLQEISSRALAKNPEERFTSAHEMAEAIRAFLCTHGALLGEKAFLRPLEPGTEPRPRQIGDLGKGAPPREAPKPTRTQSEPSSARSARWFLAAALVVLLLVTAGVYFSFRFQPETRLTPELTPAPVERDEPSEPIPPSAPTRRERAAHLAADAALALSSGQIEEARSLLAEGKLLDPQNPRWAPLRDQLRAREAEALRKSNAADHIRNASRFLDAGEYQRAIEAFKKALEYDLENQEARSGLDRANDLKQQAERARESTASVPGRRLVESETEYMPDDSGAEEVLGFVMEEGLEVKETADPYFPAQITIELDPVDANPGEPYVLRVQVFNDGYRALEFQSLELVSRFGSKIFGKGQPIPLRTERVAPQSTAVLYEIAGTWKESQNHGEIEVTIGLVEGGKLTKSIHW